MNRMEQLLRTQEDKIVNFETRQQELLSAEEKLTNDNATLEVRYLTMTSQCTRHAENTLDSINKESIESGRVIEESWAITTAARTEPP